MPLLWDLCEVAALAEAHRYLPVLAFHIAVMRFHLKLNLAVHISSKHILKTVIARIYVVLASILDGQTLLERCNAGGLKEFFLPPNYAQLACISINALFADGRRVSCCRRR